MQKEYTNIKPCAELKYNIANNNRLDMNTTNPEQMTSTYTNSNSQQTVKQVRMIILCKKI